VLIKWVDVKADKEIAHSISLLQETEHYFVTETWSKQLKLRKEQNGAKIYIV
jgi:hypothetical protein